MISAATAIAITALNGTFASLTLEQDIRDAGPKPPSRENAKHIREALVRQAMPQKSWPTVEMISSALKAARVERLVKIASEDAGAEAVAHRWRRPDYR